MKAKYTDNYKILHVLEDLVLLKWQFFPKLINAVHEILIKILAELYFKRNS